MTFLVHAAVNKARARNLNTTGPEITPGPLNDQKIRAYQDLPLKLISLSQA